MSAHPVMSQPSGHGSASYEPISVGEGLQDIPYNVPSSPNLHVPSPEIPPSDGVLQTEDLPPGAARPRFVGAALVDEGSRQSYASSQGTYTGGYDDNSSPAARPRFMGAALADEGIRQSYASSQGTYTGGYDDNSSSVFALNAARDTSSSRGYSYVPYEDDPHDADLHGSGAAFGDVPMSPAAQQFRYLEEKRTKYVPPRKSKRLVVTLSIVIGLILVAVAVVIAVYFTVIKKHPSTSGNSSTNNNGSSPSGNGGNSSTPNSNIVKSGGDGSTVTMDDGSTFVYSNKFGGAWYYDADDPFNTSAQANSWTPPLNQSFRYGVDRIFGVNLGGWLVTEPFIAPALFEKYINTTSPPVDEWTLSQAMAADTTGGGINQLEDHYKTFITEKDFADIAGAGLNYVRIPLAYWAIEVRAGEPFLPKVSWTYFLNAIKWARKYGIRINLDFHAVPGSQNGWNHSGKLGSINFLYGPMGMANTQRTLDYIRIITEFVSQPQYKDVVTMFGILNEPRGSPILGQENLANFYGEAYNVVRTASGLGQGNGPFISFHEGFFGPDNWAGFLANGDRMALDLHPYVCFTGQSSKPISSYATTPCNAWGAQMNGSMKSFGLTAAGEFSNAVTDCGKWVNGVNLGTRYEGTYEDGGTWPSQGSCDTWTDYQSWTQSDKTATMQFAKASMDALGNWFFWTWKIGNSSISGKVEAPSWSYKLGLDNGWMPLDPRDSSGVCGDQNPFNGGLQPWQTGGAGAGLLVSSSSLVWPPTSISNAGPVSLLPTYTPTGSIVTLPVPTFTQSGGNLINAGDGWVNTADNTGMNVPIATCSYLDPWVGSAAPPSPLCSGGAKKDNIPPPPMITPRP